ncbi:hypothetical protein [Flavobacterium sp. GT3R68]|uniref:hypothetical protein n=1 Tax=Flavobacterium sp. GT3R68 TaxID=2594437 RepID=UPI000F8857C3|nr:hypothetical protein [Flavobacterium sp. GT3R68]RTY94937.1 hypothetical protein EKL32_08430 [Flavobacterium sp. GSN2]TRW91741.1 hypothetical protein FNW07_07605 [Flavobacterium sp. GT3R68]
MKNFIKTHSFFIIFSFLFLLILLLLSCQREDIQYATGARNNPNYLRTEYQNCEAHCIIENGLYFEKSAQKIITWGGAHNNKFTKTIDIRYFNTERDFVIRVRSSNGWNDLMIDGVSSWTHGPVAAGVWQTYSYPLHENWQQCNLESFRLKVGGNGPAADFFISYNLVGVCDPCETLFIGEALSCGSTREAVYTLTSAEDLSYVNIEGSLIDFTGPNALITILGGNLASTQSISGPISNRIIKIKGSLRACETAIIHVSWNATNYGGPITGNWSVRGTNQGDIAPVITGLRCH